MWILNVGDIKPAEYQTELFMDMAWNIGRVQQTGVTGHLSHFLSRESGLFQLLLCYLCCRSITGWHTSVNRSLWDIQEPKEKDPKYKIVTDLPWSEGEIRKRLSLYQALEDRAEVWSRKNA